MDIEKDLHDSGEDEFQDAIADHEQEEDKDEKVTVKNYWPLEEDSHLVFGKHEQRLLFWEPQNFRQDEMNRILEFQNWLTENELDVPEKYDYREMFRWLQSMKFDFRETYNAIYANFEFFKNILPVNIYNMNQYFNSGFLYFL